MTCSWGKWPQKNGSLHADALAALGPLAGLAIGDPVHQSKGVAVGQDLARSGWNSVQFAMSHVLPLSSAAGCRCGRRSPESWTGRSAHRRCRPCVGHHVQIAGRDRAPDSGWWRADSRPRRAMAVEDGLHRAGGAQHVAGHGLGGADGQACRRGHRTTVLTAAVSPASFRGVEVPWALI